MQGHGITPGRALPARWVWIQAVLAAVIIVIAVLAPPSRGAFLVVPVVPGAKAEMLNQMLASDARITGMTRRGGLLIVFGERDRLVTAVLNHGAVLLRAPAIVCGSPPKFNRS